MVSTETHTLWSLELLSEAELEAIIDKNAVGTELGNDARFILGRLLIEGSNPEKVARNEKKGVNWIKDCAKAGHMQALEYKTYFDIRFDKQPNLKKITEALHKIIETTGSSRACNTMAEFCHAQSKTEDKKSEAAKFYQQSADKGCLIGTHWMGVFYMEGFGVSQNLDKAEDMLKKAYRMGNAQSAFQLHLLYKESAKKDVVKSYHYLSRAVESGVTFFEDFNAFFKENYDVLAPVFIAQKKPPASVDTSKQADIENMHDAWVNEMKQTFMAALGKDRMYQRPAGFVTDQQIWMINVLRKYLTKNVLHFDQSDFLQAVRIDLGPLLGDAGLWALKNYSTYQAEKGNDEKKRKARVAMELISNYLENGFDQLSKESKYNLANKFGPKKMADRKQLRREMPHLYSWSHYAPLQYLEALRKREDEVENAKKNKGTASLFNMCSYCGTPESQTIKHKRCSQCKQRLYCSMDCQKFDWQKGHKGECKTLAAAAQKGKK